MGPSSKPGTASDSYSGSGRGGVRGTSSSAIKTVGEKQSKHKDDIAVKGMKEEGVVGSRNAKELDSEDEYRADVEFSVEDEWAPLVAAKPESRSKHEQESLFSEFLNGDVRCFPFLV